VNSKWNKDLNGRPETLKLIQENAGNILEVRGISKDFLSGIPAAQQLRERMDKWVYIKLKIFCTTKEMVSKLKRPPTEWEKISASYTSYEGLMNRIYKELKKLNSPKINEPINKWAAEQNRTLSKEEIQMAKKHMKKCSPFLAMKELQIKPHLYSISPLLKYTSCKTPQTTDVGEDVGKKKPLYTAGGNAS
jgi:hypothetical protein